MEKITIKLKQHTPLLHFQHDQKGAILRATEVKPKLDRFIIEKLTRSEAYRLKAIEYLTEIENKKEEARRKSSEQIESDYNSNKGYYQALAMGWLVGKGEHPALNYKMKIISTGNRITEDPEAFFDGVSPMFFANRGVNVIRKNCVTSDNNEISIIAKCTELLYIIKEYIAAFFMINNFGTRQTKGYGSYTILKSENPDIKAGTIPSKLFFDIQGGRNQKKLFEEIEWFYKAIRSGINDCKKNRDTGKNETTLYFKSLMFSYAKLLNNQWDKKTIKEHFYPIILADQQDKHNASDLLMLSSSSPYFTYKDCLGFSTIETWRIPYDLTVKKESLTVDRLKSPILFKPTYVASQNLWRVYIIPSVLPEEFYDATIKVSDGVHSSFELFVDRNFTVHGYMNYLFKQQPNGTYRVNINNNFLCCNTNRRYPADPTRDEQKRNRILSIFAEIRKNYNR